MDYETFLTIGGLALVVLLGVRVYMALGSRHSRQWMIGKSGEDTVVVRENARFRELVFVSPTRELVQSRQDRTNKLRSGWGYVDGLHVGMLLDERPRRILFLGGGACIGPRQFEAIYDDATIDVVDSEAIVVDAAHRFFGLRTSERLRVYVADARQFACGCSSKEYDLVVLDAYGAYCVPAHLVTTQFFELVRRTMTDDGAFILNLIGNLDSDESSMRSILASIAHVFESYEIAIFAVPDPSETDGQLRRGVVRNSIALVAKKVCSAEKLAERASSVAPEVAPHLSEIVRRRFPVDVTRGRVLTDDDIAGKRWLLLD
ncbi:MAG: fused MFS/spermidine synthase [Polyangiaceae bacterium]|nr:fused MFS/spermidine synthase [Polyangiaceae bacterium]